MRGLSVLPAILIAATAMAFSLVGAAGMTGKAGLNQAVALYHQGSYDSSLARLEALESTGPWKHRDSLSLLQYLGMSCSRLNRDSASIGYFSQLLQLDSLFRFPKNEDSLILKNFSAAQEAREGRLNPSPAPITLAPPSTDTAGGPTRTSLRLETQTYPAPALAGPTLVGATEPAPSSARSPRIGLAYGALPLGIGWVARKQAKSGLVLGLLQAGGLFLSIYASEIQANEQNDTYAIRDHQEMTALKQWQWTQRVSLSMALGAYLFSLIASAGD